MTRRTTPGWGWTERLCVGVLTAFAAGCSLPPPQLREPPRESPIERAMRQPSQAESRDALERLALEPGLSADAQQAVADAALRGLDLPSDRSIVLRALLANASATPATRDLVHALLQDPDAFRMSSQRAILRCQVQALDRRWDVTGERPIRGSSRTITR